MTIPAAAPVEPQATPAVDDAQGTVIEGTADVVTADSILAEAASNSELFDSALADALAPPAADKKPAKEKPAPVEDKKPEGEEGEPAPKVEDKSKPVESATPPAGTVAKPEDTPAAQPTPVAQPLDAVAIGKAVAEAMKQPAPAPKVEPEPEVTVESFMTDAEKATVQAYQKEWSEVHTAQQIMLRATIQHTQHQIINQVARALAPLAAEMHESKIERQLNVIRTAHPDYEALAPKVQEWIAATDELTRPALENVIKNGDAAQVVKLFAAYKKATGTTTAVPAESAPSATQATNAPAAQPAPTVVVKKAPSAEALAATSAVTSQRAANPVKDVNDFDGALAEALSKTT